LLVLVGGMSRLGKKQKPSQTKQDNDARERDLKVRPSAERKRK